MENTMTNEAIRAHLGAVRTYEKVRDLYAAGRCGLALLESAERVCCRTEDAAYAAIATAHAARRAA